MAKEHKGEMSGGIVPYHQHAESTKGKAAHSGRKNLRNGGRAKEGSAKEEAMESAKEEKKEDGYKNGGGMKGKKGSKHLGKKKRK